MEFDKDKMLKMRKEDKLIDFMCKDLTRRGHNEEEAMLFVFNSEILGDSAMEEKYKQL